MGGARDDRTRGALAAGRVARGTRHVERGAAATHGRALGRARARGARETRAAAALHRDRLDGSCIAGRDAEDVERAPRARGRSGPQRLWYGLLVALSLAAFPSDTHPPPSKSRESVAVRGA